MADGPHRDSPTEGPGRFSRAPWERDAYDDWADASPAPQLPRPPAAGPPPAGGARPPAGDQPYRGSQDNPSGPLPRRQQPGTGPHPTGGRPASGSKPAGGHPGTAGGQPSRGRPARTDQAKRRTNEPDDEFPLGRPPADRRRGWLVDDEEPIRPSEYFAEVGSGRGERGGTRLTEKKARRNNRSLAIGKVAAAVLAIAVILVSGVAWGTKKWTGDQFRQVSALDLDSTAIVDAGKQAGAENFLLVGSDTRGSAEASDETADSVGDAEAVRGARSDTLLLAHIPADRSRVVVLSFPRDVQIDRPPCEIWDSESGAYTGQHDQGENSVKINTAYQVGGPKCATQVVQRLSGISVNHFVSVDFAGFTAMTDTTAGVIGGVRVCVDRPLKDSFLGEIAAQPGPVDLAGVKALNFVRARHVEGDPTSDYGRIHRQQAFLAALVRGALSGQVLTDTGKLTRLVDALAANTFTDNVTMDDLLELGGSLRGVDAGTVSFVTVPTTGTANDRGNEELRTEEAAALFRSVIDGAAPPGTQAGQGEQPPTEPPPPAIVEPSEVKLQVLNGTAQGGLAGQIARKLGQVGFDVVKVGNAAEQAPQTVIRYSAAKEAHARTVAAAVPGAELALDPSMGGALELVLGQGFDGEVKPVQAGQPAPDTPADPPQGAPPAGLDMVTAAEGACGS